MRNLTAQRDIKHGEAKSIPTPYMKLVQSMQRGESLTQLWTKRNWVKTLLRPFMSPLVLSLDSSFASNQMMIPASVNRQVWLVSIAYSYTNNPGFAWRKAPQCIQMNLDPQKAWCKNSLTSNTMHLATSTNIQPSHSLQTGTTRLLLLGIVSNLVKLQSTLYNVDFFFLCCLFLVCPLLLPYGHLLRRLVFREIYGASSVV